MEDHAQVHEEEFAETSRLLDIPLTVEVILDRRFMRVREILALEVGNVITLGRSAGDNVDIFANGVLLCFGEMVVIENFMGVRITDFPREE
jgi:flagellar motor switch protein FliN/FliY